MFYDCGFAWVDSNVSVLGLEIKKKIAIVSQFIKSPIHYETC